MLLAISLGRLGRKSRSSALFAFSARRATMFRCVTKCNDSVEEIPTGFDQWFLQHGQHCAARDRGGSARARALRECYSDRTLLAFLRTATDRT